MFDIAKMSSICPAETLGIASLLIASALHPTCSEYPIRLHSEKWIPKYSKVSTRDTFYNLNLLKNNEI